MKRQAIATLLVLAASPALANGCVEVTQKIAFCPGDTMWAGLPWHRIPDPPATLWETEGVALLLGEIPVRFEGGPIEVGARELAEVIDDFAAVTEGSEEIARFAPLGEDVAAWARVTRHATEDVVEYVTLYAIDDEILIVHTIARDDRLTQDHGLRHEQALLALQEVGL